MSGGRPACPAGLSIVFPNGRFGAPWPSGWGRSRPFERRRRPAALQRIAALHASLAAMRYSAAAWCSRLNFRDRPRPDGRASSSTVRSRLEPVVARTAVLPLNDVLSIIASNALRVPGQRKTAEAGHVRNWQAGHSFGLTCEPSATDRFDRHSRNSFAANQDSGPTLSSRSLNMMLHCLER